MTYYIGVLVPFGTVYVFNWIMFILTMTSLSNRPVLNTANATKRQKWRKNFWVSVCLSVLFGLAWSLGLLASNGIPKAFGAIFECAFTLLLASQGILLFVIYCVTSPEVRKFWKHILLSAYHCCRYRSTRAFATSSLRTQSNRLTDTQMARSSDKQSDSMSPASQGSLRPHGYSASTASTLSPPGDSKSKYRFSSAIVSDASVFDTSFAATTEPMQRETSPGRFPRVGSSTSSNPQEGNARDVIELLPYASEGSPLTSAVALNPKGSAYSPVQVPDSDYSGEQTSAV